ncbi:unnamed protein product [Onchocerca flexuosa]|uniref:DUF5678 domain-containing protein n=1 Tax=Onchocerca flexuosa TaxID=387005 RepID=A0A183HXM0_9BILA|nr:unnamed protein product [Onchocerca flexuosa]
MTARRPVPLEHFLYTGQDGKTKKDMFKIIDSNGQFIQKGYSLASAAKANIRKANANVGPVGYRPNNKILSYFENSRTFLI